MSSSAASSSLLAASNSVSDCTGELGLEAMGEVSTSGSLKYWRSVWYKSDSLVLRLEDSVDSMTVVALALPSSNDFFFCLIVSCSSDNRISPNFSGSGSLDRKKEPLTELSLEGMPVGGEAIAATPSASMGSFEHEEERGWRGVWLIVSHK